MASSRKGKPSGTLSGRPRSVRHVSQATLSKRGLSVIKKFPKAIEDFANAFVTLQKKRHEADYNPLAQFSKSTVQADIALAEQAIQAFKAEKTADRRALCAWVLFKVPRK